MNYEREPPNMKEMGPKAYKNRIDRDNNSTGNNKNLPYNFSAPSKVKPCKITLECEKCGKVLFVTEDAILVVCGSCKGLTRIKDIKKRC